MGRENAPHFSLQIRYMTHYISTDLFRTVLARYSLSPHGIHGISHWGRVYENGCRIAETTCANLKVVQLFALFHDIQRQNEGYDPEHGLRAAKYAETFHRAAFLDLSEQEFHLLYRACEDHAEGLTEADITVQTCWDADRLDLNRVGILPDPALLCTEAARSREIRARANERAALRMMPKAIKALWGIECIM